MSDEDKFQIEYEQANEWARHYSNVRMALVPGLAGLSLAILGFNWGTNRSTPQLHVAIIATLIWLCAYVILWLFTALEVRELWYSRLLRSRLLGKTLSTTDTPTPGSLHEQLRNLIRRLGGPANVFPVNIVERYSGSGVATIDAVAPAELRRPHHWFFLDPLRDLPFWIGTLLTVVYLVFVLVWLRIV